MMRDANKHKRLELAQEHLNEARNDGFTDVLWTDESSIMLESHKRFCCRKRVLLQDGLFNSLF